MRNLLQFFFEKLRDISAALIPFEILMDIFWSDQSHKNKFLFNFLKNLRFKFYFLLRKRPLRLCKSFDHSLLLYEIFSI